MKSHQTFPETSIGDKDRYSLRLFKSPEKERTKNIPEASIGDKDRYSTYTGLSTSQGEDSSSTPELSIGDADRYSKYSR